MKKIENHQKNEYKLFEIIFILLITLLIFSYSPTIKESLSISGNADFQWSPTKCLVENINHYHSILNNDGRCKIIMSQGGEYQHGLYILLYPLALLSWESAKTIWTILNVFLAFFIPYLLSKKFKLDKIQTLIIIFFFCFCATTRVNIIMGQQTLLVFLFLILPFIYKSKTASIFSGISYFKYNIGYALFCLYIFQKKYKSALLSSIPCFLGYFLYCLITETDFSKLINIFDPIKLMINTNTTFSRVYLLSFINYIEIFNFKYTSIILLTFSIILTFLFIIKISNIQDNLLKLSCLNIVVLIFLPHWSYDNILLLPLLIFAVKNYKTDLKLSRMNLLISIYFLQVHVAIIIYLNRIWLYFDLNTKFITEINNIFPYFNIIILLITLIINMQYNKINKLS